MQLPYRWYAIMSEEQPHSRISYTHRISLSVRLFINTHHVHVLAIQSPILAPKNRNKPPPKRLP